MTNPRYLLMRKWIFFVLQAMASLLVLSAGRASNQEPVVGDGLVHSHQLVVAILPFEREVKDGDATIWRIALASSIYARLKQTKDLHILANGEYALDQLNVRDRNLDDVSRVESFCKLTGATRVLWTSCYQKDNKWIAFIRILAPSVASSSTDLEIASTNWAELAAGATEGILTQLGVRPTVAERQRIQQCWTDSSEALEAYSRAISTPNQALQETYLRRAVEADPKFAAAWATLAITLGQEGKMKEAVKAAVVGVEVRPEDAYAHKELGLVLLNAHEYESAEKALRTAVQLDRDDAEAFKLLGDVQLLQNRQAEAISNYASALCLEPCAPFAKTISSQLDYWKPRQIPVYFSKAPVAECSGRDLENELKRKLTPAELSLVVDPLTSNPAIDHWAEQLAGGGADDFQKAKKIFEALIDPGISGNPLQKVQYATAQEVFASWKDTNFTANCQELTYLFVALGRAIGIKAYGVQVDEACDGSRSLHTCAAIILPKGILLVDPAYYWFGAPHRKFAILDDVEMIALHMCTSKDLEQIKIANKLAPNLCLVAYNFACKLISLNRWKEAQDLLPTVSNLDTTGTMSGLLKALCAMHEDKTEEAVAALRHAIKMDSKVAILHIRLANVFAAQGNFVEAHRECEQAMRCPHTKEDEQAVERFNSRIEEAERGGSQ